MKILSPRFEHNKKIPEKYTCDGENISPPLEIKEIPKNAKSLVLIMEDPDVPKSIRPDGMWDHWVVFNIPPNTEKIEEGKPTQGTKGSGTRNTLNYQGPCPPDREHRYFFKIFALDTLLNLKEGSTKAQVLEAMNNHIIAQDMLIGVYERKK